MTETRFSADTETLLSTGSPTRLFYLLFLRGIEVRASRISSFRPVREKRITRNIASSPSLMASAMNIGKSGIIVRNLTLGAMRAGSPRTARPCLSLGQGVRLFIVRASGIGNFKVAKLKRRAAAGCRCTQSCHARLRYTRTLFFLHIGATSFSFFQETAHPLRTTRNPLLGKGLSAKLSECVQLRTTLTNLGPTPLAAIAGHLSRVDRCGRRCPPSLPDRSKKRVWGIATLRELGIITVSVWGRIGPGGIAGIAGQAPCETRSEGGVRLPIKPTDQRRRQRRASPLHSRIS